MSKKDKQDKKYKSSHELESVEPRLLFSAGLEGVLAAEQLETPPDDYNPSVVEQTIDSHSTESAEASAADVRVELIFVDTDTPEYQTLLSDLLAYPDDTTTYQVFELDNTQDGIEQITAVLSGYDDVSAIHILSHGTEGAIDLGGTTLDSQTLAANAELVSSWSGALTDSADILIYGCNLAGSADGQLLVNSLATLTGADVAASDDLTGNAQLGGDWELEYAKGDIETSVVASQDLQSSWDHLLNISIESPWTNLVVSTDRSTTISEDYTVTAAPGSDRLLMVTMVTRFGFDQTIDVTSASFGGVQLHEIVEGSSVSTRNGVWMGYLLDSEILAGNQTLTVSFTSTVSDPTGTKLLAATYVGVDQTTPINDSSANNTKADAPITFGSQIDYAAGAEVVYVASYGGNTNTNTTEPAGYSKIYTNEWSGLLMTTIGHMDDTTTAGNSPASTSVDFEGTDANHSLAVVALNPVVNDDAPTQVNNIGLTAAEGATTTITNTELRFTDTEQSAANVNYTVTTAPANGQLELTTNPGVAITSFTQAQIDANQVVYVHDGSATTSDEFKFDVDDGQGNTTLGQFVTGITNETNLTNNAADTERDAVWSPDGTQIAFYSDRDGNNEIYVMDADGSNVVRLTNDAGSDNRPSWSPDGSQIVFQSTRGGNNDIYVIDADGTNETRLTNHAAVDGWPEWSPDGTQIAFMSGRDGNNEIYVMDADGSNQTRITNDAANDKTPSWSSDGTQLTFVRDDNIWVMDAGGTNLIQLTDNGDIDGNPSWSPDGTRIAFHTDRDGNYEIYVMDADGSNLTRLTNNGGIEGNPEWSPDGSQILFHTNRDGNYEIYVADVLHENRFAITVTPVVDNTAPTQANNTGSTVTEGGTDTIASTELSYTDSQQTAANVTYTVNSGPSNGQFELTTDPGNAVTTWTQAQIDANEVVYVHDGSNTTSDSITFTVDDGQGNSLAGQSFAITVNAINDAPILTSTALAPTWTENGGPVNLFSATSVDLVESGDLVNELSINVSGLADGIHEILMVDGQAIELTELNSETTAANGYAVSVSAPGSIAYLTISRVGGFTALEAQTLIDGLAYDNTSDTPLGAGRIATLATIQDDGGTANGGSNTTVYNLDSTVTVVATNDAPTGSVTIAGTATEDQTLTASNTLADADGLGAISYQWQRDGSDIAGATVSSYTLTDADVGATITVVASYTDGQGTNESVASTGVGPIANVNDAPVDLQATATTDGGISLNADGGNDVYFVADDGAGLLGGLTTVTIEASFSITTPGADLSPLLSYADGANDEELALFLKSDGRIWFGASSNGSPIASTTGFYPQLFDGEKHQVSVSWDASNGAVDFYIDGQFMESITGYQVGQTITGTGELVFGQDQDSVLGGFKTIDVFSGELYDVRIFNDVRTAGEIAGSYDLTLPNTESGMISNWTFNDLSTGGVITDSVSGNNLTEQHVVGTGFSTSTPSLSFSIPENSANGTTIGSVVAIDPDTGDSFAYTLVDDAGGRFEINSTIGQITLANTSLVDYETAASHNITIRVTDSGGLTYDEVFSISIENVNDSPTGSVTISGVATEDQTLTASNTLADADGLGVISYQWQRDGSDIAGETASTYTLTDADVGASITVIASYTDGQGTSESVTSTGVGPIANVNDAPTGSVTIAGTATEDQTLTASNTLADADGLGVISYQWQRDGSDIAGATASTYTLADADVGASITVIASYSDLQSTNESVSSASVGPIANVNDVPTVSATAINPTYTEGDAAVDLFSAVNVSTVESGQTIEQLVLTVTNVTDGANETITIDGSVVYLVNGDNATTVSGYDYMVNIVGNTATITIDTVGTSVVAAQNLIDGFVYQNTSQNPTSAIRAVTLTSITDSGGGTDTSNPNITSTVTVVALNDAPVLDNNGLMQLTTITEDDINNSGDLVSAIIASAGGDRITDADAGALEGIAITGLTSSNGTWQYNTGSGWTDVGTVSVAESLLLDATDSLRFLPDGLNADTAFVTFAAWDQTSGVAGTKVDTTVYGGSTAFSSNLETAVIVVTAVNDAPVGVPMITGTVTEDQTLSADTSGITDADGLGVFSYQWLRDGVVIVGATSSTYTLGDADVGATITVTASYTDGQGSAESVTSAATTAVTNVNDAPTGLVTISGVATEDQTLTASNTLADADGLGVISYQWLRDGVAIGGATNSTYTLGDADVGATLTVAASYTDGQGTSESVTSAGVGPVANVNDAPVGVPMITGTVTEDQTLSADTSGITDADGLGVFSYQWLRDGVVIAGATSSTYTLGDADVGAIITVTASYTDGQGSAESVTSAATTAVTNVNDTPTGLVTISGVATEDQTLTASNTLADADGLGVISYQWLRDGVAIGGATSSSYTLGDADVGATITVAASYTDGQGTSESVTSAGVGPVANVNDAPVGVPTIIGTVTEDQTLSADTSGITDADGLGVFSYQWYRDGVAIGGATASTYTLGDADVGAQISVQVSYTDGQGSSEGPLTSTQTAAVANVNDSPTGSVTISGTPTEDQTLTASNTLNDADGLGAISYQWLRDGVAIGGATSSSYTLGDADVGATITVAASYTDGQGTSESVTSAGVGPIANVNDAPVGVPTITGTVTEDQTLSADTSGVTDADGLGVFSYQWLRDGVVIGGATNSTYTLGDADVGGIITVTASYTDGQGSAESVTSAGTTAVTNVNDAPTGLVTISGVATEDQTLTASNTLADADGLGVISYQWLRDGVAIGGATNSTYTLGDADVGATITVAASYTDGQGTSESVTSAGVGPVANVNDAPVGVPTITGTVTEDQTLSADTSSITDADGLGVFSYQWLRDGVAIAGATSSTYTLGDADVGATITVTASYTDGQGSAESVTSAGTTAVTNVNDAPTGLVTISGTPTEDEALTASNTLNDADGLGVISYQWLRDGVAIGGATNSTYTLDDADVSSTITVTASYMDGQGTSESVTSTGVGPVANVNDAPVGVPTIIGTVTEDQMLSADTSGITDADGLGVFSYQWLRDGVMIAGATSSTYTLGDADVGATITVTASYTDGQGSAESVTSAVTTAVTNVNDAPTGLVTISGVATEDQTLTASNTLADADGLGVIGYQWLRDGVAIGGATNSTYTLGDADVGATLTVAASYTDGQGTDESVASAGVGPIANVNDAPVGVPTISGTVTEDQTLSADTSGVTDADGLGVFSYQWLRDGVAIAGATSSTYTLGDADVGTQISVQVSYTDGQGSSEGPLTSAQTAAVTNVNDAPVGVPTINGTVTEDQILTADTSGITDVDGLGTFSYQWLRDGVAIGGITNSTYTLGDADVGTQISVQVSYTDLNGTAESVSSAQTAAVVSINDTPTGSVTISGTPAEDQILTASNTLADADGMGPVSYQWYRNGVAIGGATNSTYNLGDADVGTSITVTASYTDGQGTSESVTSAGVGPIANINDTPAGLPTITGIAAEDQLLTADTSGVTDADGLGAFNYQWLRDGVNIAGATGSTYTLGDTDVGTQISVQVSYTDGQGTAEGPLTSVQTAAVTNVNDAPVGVPVITGTVTEDQTLTADTSGVSDADGLGAFSYQWLRDGVMIAGATSSTYTLGDADVGTLISVQVSYTDGQGAAESATSVQTAAVANINDAPVLDITGVSVLTQIDEGDTNTSGDSVASIIASAGGDSITDVDTSAGEGIAITGADNSNGAWEYSTDSGASWFAIGTVSDSSALLLSDDAGNRIRFVPATNFNGSAQFNYRAWDQMDGNVNAMAGVDVSTNGDATAYSTATESASIAIRPVQVIMYVSTSGDVSVSGAPGLDSWDAGEVIALGDPNANFEPGTTDGTLYKFLDLRNFQTGAVEPAVDGIHQVSNNTTIGGNGGPAMDLFVGDILFAINSNSVQLTGSDLVEITTNKKSLYMFRPDTPGDYSAGTFSMVLDNFSTNEVEGISLVERDTMVGDTLLQSGTFLFNPGNSTDIWLYTVDGAGAGTTSGNAEILITGNHINMNNASAKISGLDLVEVDINLGDTSLAAGNILVTLDGNDAGVGNNNLSVTSNDVFYLDVTTTTMGVTSTTVANAYLLIEGADLSLDTANEEITALSLEIKFGSGNEDPDISFPGSSISYTENDPAVLIDAGATVNDPDSFDFSGGILRVDFESGGMADDRLAIRNEGAAPGQVGVVSNTVTYGGVTVGTFTGGTGTNPLVVNFNSSSTPVVVQAVLRNITYENISDDPATGPRTVRVVVSDGDGGSSNVERKTINMAAVNDAPAVAANAGMTVAEGSTGSVITTAMLNEADPDDSGTGVTYTVTTVPANGTLYLSGIVIGTNDTFTQADIDAGLVTYNHDGSQNLSDSFIFSMADGGEDGAIALTGQVFSFTVTNVNDAPVGLPTIIGTATEDQLLTADTSGISDEDGLGLFSYQWFRDGVAISGATASTYTLGGADVGTTITVVASYTDSEGANEWVGSAGTGPIANVNDVPVGVPMITGTVEEDQVLTAETTGISDADGLGAFSYQWLRDGVAIGGATASTYTLGDADVGTRISVQVSYTDGNSTAEGPLTSVQTAPVSNINDAPTGAVSISGVATEDQILTASNTLADADGLGAISYQWYRDGVVISGATASTYILGDADVGTSITVTASYNDGQGTSESATSAGVGPIANINDTPVGLPTITGIVTEDQLLTADTTGISDADGLGAFSYQWVRDGVNIAGATGSTYTLGDADVGTQISVQVSYTDGHGTSEGPLTSTQTAAVANVNDTPSGLPSITGTATEDQLLTADISGIADADGLGTFSYQWLRDGVAIGGATASTYTLGDADVGTRISVQVSYTDGNSTAEGPLTSVQTAPVANINDAPTGAVSIAGVATEDQILTASNTLADADGLGAISYQWYRDGVVISGATASTYTLGDADVGTSITVTASYNDGQGTSESVTSAGVGPIANINDTPVGLPTITGIVTEDQLLTADTSGIADADGLGAFSYQWLRDGVIIAGATGSTYTLGDADVGTQISVQVSYTDGHGTSEGPLTSAQTAAVTNINDAPVGAPTITGIVTEDQVLTADTGGISDADGLGAFGYQWYRDGVAVGGGTASTYTLGDADFGTTITVAVSYTDGQGTAETVTSAGVGPIANVNDAPTGSVVIDNMNPGEGDLLTASNSLADADGLSGPISYQWYRDGVAIGGATGTTYTTVQADVGTVITVAASYTDDRGTAESVTSAGTVAVTSVNDVPVGQPVITGTATEDQTLTADTSGISDEDGLGAFSYQWLRDGVMIAGATGSTYTLGDADVGATLTVTASYTDGGGTAESVTSAGVGPIANVNDAPVGMPTITGTASEDQTLTADTTGISDADGTGAFSYQWYRDGVVIAGATASTYTLDDADVGAQIFVQVSYTDGHGTNEGPLTSAQTGPVTNVNDTPVGVPTISGTVQEDQILTANTSGISDADGLGAFSYQWYRDGVAIGGATASTYTLGDADVGSQISLQVNYTDGYGTAEGPLTSVQTGPVININDVPVGVPAITGTVQEDQILTADASGISDVDGLGAFSYQWYRDGVIIAGATGSTYTLGDADVGTNITVTASYTDGQGTAEGPLTSAQTAAVANVNDTPVGVPTITGTVQEDQILTAETAGISDADGLGAFSYQWLRDGVIIAGATGSTYTLGDADVGTQVSVQVSYTDGHGTSEGPLTSAQTAAVANVNDAPSGLPTITGSATEDQLLTADISGIADADGLGTFSYQWLRDGVAIGGANASTYTLGDADVGTRISVQVSYTDGNSTAEGPLTSVQTTPVSNINDAPTGAVSIAGVATEDQILTASNTLADADGLGAISYQWYRDGVVISGATASTYTLGDADVGTSITVAASYNDGQGTSESATSAGVGPIANINDAPTGSVAIDNMNPGEGDLLTASNSLADADGLSGPISYQWYRDGVAIGGATGTTYTTVQADVGTVITVAASYTDDRGTSESVTSAGTVAVTNVNDVPVGQPVITGTATEDQTLTADTSGISDEDGLGAFSYQWLRDGVIIAGATGSTYTLGDADVGASITVTASYTDGQGTAESVGSAGVGPVANVNDTPVGVPTITGTVQEDQILTAETAGISDADGLGAFSYQWLRDGVIIAGATGSTYTLDDADVGTQVSVQVSYTDGHGTGEGPLTSAQTAAVANVNDAPSGLPTITGSATEDQLLTADISGIADADGLGTFSYQWLRDGVAIGGANASTYTLGDADVGTRISVQVSYTDGNSTAEGPLTSVQTTPVSNINDAPTGAVSIAGVATEDQILTASNTLADADGLGAISYQWYRDGVVISGATASTYTLGDADVGTSITVTASYTDGQGTAETVTSAGVGPIANVNDAPVGLPTIAGIVTEDQLLTADTTSISDADGLGAFSYQWLRDGVIITGATGSTYTLGDADVGTQISVQVSYTDGHGTSEGPLTSAQTASVVNVNDTPTGAVTLDNMSPVEGDTLTASNTLADADGLSGAISYQWYRDGVAIGGATASTYTTVQADVGAAITAVASYTDDQGTNESVSSAGTAMVTNANNAPTGTVTISGTPTEDQTLTASNTLADVDGLGVIGYQWYRDDVTIGSATNATYTLGDADVGTSITVTASYTDGNGTAESVTSAAVGPVANVNDAPAGLPMIAGTVIEEQTLTADTSGIHDDDGLGAISFQWYRDGVAIAGATASTYTLSNVDVGTQLSVQVSYTDDQGAVESVTSGSTADVGAVAVTEEEIDSLDDPVELVNTQDNLPGEEALPGEVLMPDNNVPGSEGLAVINPGSFTEVAYQVDSYEHQDYDEELYQDEPKTANPLKYVVSAIAQAGAEATEEMLQLFDLVRIKVSEVEKPPLGVFVASVGSISLSFSVGVVAWVMRGGAVALSMMSSMSVLKSLDPMPVIDARRKNKKGLSPDHSDDDIEVDNLFDDDSENAKSGNMESEEEDQS